MSVWGLLLYWSFHPFNIMENIANQACDRLQHRHAAILCGPSAVCVGMGLRLSSVHPLCVRHSFNVVRSAMQARGMPTVATLRWRDVGCNKRLSSNCETREQTLKNKMIPRRHSNHTATFFVMQSDIGKNNPDLFDRFLLKSENMPSTKVWHDRSVVHEERHVCHAIIVGFFVLLPSHCNQTHDTLVSISKMAGHSCLT